MSETKLAEARLAGTARMVVYERALRRIRDGLMVGAVMWCGLALIFALSLDPVLGFIVTTGAWIGLAACAAFVILNVVIVALEIRISGELTKASGPEALRLLLLELDTDDDLSRCAIIRALMRVIPKIAELDRGERELVHESLLALSPKREPALITALLRLLARCGDRRSLGCVYELLEVAAATPAERRVHRAALECADSLRQRLDQDVDRAYLMRPSDAPAAPPQGAATARP